MSWGYSEDTQTEERRESGGEIAEVGSMSSVAITDPDVREIMQRTGTSPEAMKALIATIETGVRNGIPPERLQLPATLSLGEVEALYEKAANMQGTSLDAIRQQQEQQNEAAMDMLRQTAGAGLAMGASNAFFSSISPANMRAFSGLAEDRQAEIALEGTRLTERGTQHAAGETMNFNEQQERGHGVNVGAGINRGQDVGRFA